MALVAIQGSINKKHHYRSGWPIRVYWVKKERIKTGFILESKKKQMKSKFENKIA